MKMCRRLVECLLMGLWNPVSVAGVGPSAIYLGCVRCQCLGLGARVLTRFGCSVEEAEIRST